MRAPRRPSWLIGGACTPGFGPADPAAREGEISLPRPAPAINCGVATGAIVARLRTTATLMSNLTPGHNAEGRNVQQGEAAPGFDFD